jgi:hypothetical protein
MPPVLKSNFNVYEVLLGHSYIIETMSGCFCIPAGKVEAPAPQSLKSVLSSF